MSEDDEAILGLIALILSFFLYFQFGNIAQAGFQWGYPNFDWMVLDILVPNFTVPFPDEYWLYAQFHLALNQAFMICLIQILTWVIPITIGFTIFVTWKIAKFHFKKERE